MEILEMADGEMRELEVLSYEIGETIITPRDGRGPKTVVDVRLHVSRTTKSLFPYYWDLTAATLTAQVVPRLEAAPSFPLVLRLHKYGVAPRARYGVEVGANG
jgi:hypothetical protein